MGVSVTITVDGSRLRIVAAAVLVAALAAPVAALAGHRFTDVPTSNTFHGHIDNLAGAGITAGCGPTTFCPDQPVTRAQMAAFLNRGLGRVASKVVSAQPSSGDQTTVGTISITPGTASGATGTGTQFVLVRFDGFAAAVSTVGCPCTMTLQLGGGQVVYQTFTSSLHYEAVSLALVVTADGAGSVEVPLRASLAGNGFQIGGTLTATTVPYGPVGTSSGGTGS